MRATDKIIVGISILCAIASVGITLYHGFAPLVQWLWGWFG